MTTEVEASSTSIKTDSPADTEIKRLHIGCWTVLIAIAAVRAWFTRYEFLGGDSLSYLDIARLIAAGHFNAIVNSYWSPGYPVVLSFFFWAFHPSAYWEFPFVHFINVLTFAGTIAAFRMFWSEVQLWHRTLSGPSVSSLPDSTFWAIGYAAFGIANLSLIRIGAMGADLLTSAFCCLAGWSTLRIRRAPSFGHSLLWGCILGLAYYAKAPLFPMAIIFILCAYSWRSRSQRSILMAGTTLVVFLLVCAPFVIAISRAEGHLTFGDAARLSEASYINGVNFPRYWQGGPPGSGMPIHPVRKLNDFPQIYEFAAENMGTYPPWFNPPYWNAGTTPHFNLKRQAAFLPLNLIHEFRLILDAGAQLVCVIVILALLCVHKPWLEGLRRLWFIWTPGLIALVMFALIHVEPRFVGDWLIFLSAGAIAACSITPDSGIRSTVWCMGVAMLVTTAATLVLQGSREAVGTDYAAGRTPDDPLLAMSLLKSGLYPGDKVAVILDGRYAYWAHLANLQVVAEIPAVGGSLADHPSMDFWEAGAELQQKSLAILGQTGARAVIAGSQNSIEESVPKVVPKPWKRIDGTHSYIYFFPGK